MTVDNETTETAPEVVAPVHSVLCRPEKSPEEKAEREARRMIAEENTKRILAIAERKAIDGKTMVADSLVKIAHAWDNFSY